MTVKPNLFVIGAPKSGTTTLADLLDQHPDILISKPKETCFHFLEYDKGVEYYLRKYFPYYAGESVVADLSILNMVNCQVTAKRLYQDFPRAKLLAILRNPVDRAYSDYLSSVNSGLETKPFEMTFALEKVRKQFDTHKIMQWQYFSRGLYADQLDRFLRYYNRDQILVLTYEAFYSAPIAGMGNIFRFIGVNENVQINPDVQRNANKLCVRSALAQRLFRGDHPLGSVIKDLLPNRSRRILRDFAKRLKNANMTPKKAKTVHPEFLEFLRDYYSESNRRLRETFHLDLSDWQI